MNSFVCECWKCDTLWCLLDLNIFQKKLENLLEIKVLYRIQACYRVMRGNFCTGFTDFMFKDKSLLEHTNLFSPNQYKKNAKVIIKYFQ